MSAPVPPVEAGRKPSLLEVWLEAGGDADRYYDLLRERGYLVPCPCSCHENGDGHCPRCKPVLPCGWSPREKRADPGRDDLMAAIAELTGDET